MKKMFWALLGSFILSYAIVAGWYLFFNGRTMVELGNEFLAINTDLKFWLGIGVFTFLIFLLVLLPFVLIFLKRGHEAPNA